MNAHSPQFKSKPHGFTVIELLVTLSILGILIMMVMPLAEVSIQRNKESQLQTNLRQIRNALDAYRQAYDQGKIQHISGASGYPPNLTVLVTGVADVSKPNQPLMFFLRRIPADPFRPDIPPEKTWGLRSYASTPQDPQPGNDVFDVYSQAPGIGLNGVPYQQW